MEIRLKNVSFRSFENLQVTITSGKIIALMGENKDDFLKLINLEDRDSGSFYIDSTRVTQKNKLNYQDRICLVKDELSYPKEIARVDEYFRYQIYKSHLSFQNETKKIQDALHLVGLDISLMNSFLSTLSKTEQALLSLAEALLFNPDVFLFQNPFESLDLKYTKHFIRILTKLKEKYGKIIIFTTNNCEEVYQYSDEFIYFKKGKIILKGPINEVYLDESFLKKEKIPIPKAIAFSNYVKESKNVHLDYYKDIRDLIKDIYRKV